MSVKKKFKNFKKLITKKPKLLLPISALLFVFIFMIFECGRAYLYINKVDDYKVSVKAIYLKDSIAKLQQAYSSFGASYFCDLDRNKIIAYVANPDMNSVENMDEIVAKVSENLADATPPPSFSSLVDFLPRPKRAKQVSNDINSSLESIDQLIKPNAKNEYCSGVGRVLEISYFLDSITKPEGVGALLVGQIEEYQSVIAKTTDELLSMKFPTELNDEQIRLIEVFNTISTDLKGNENYYVSFSRKIGVDVQELDEVLKNISDKMSDVQKIPESLDVKISVLE